MAHLPQTSDFRARFSFVITALAIFFTFSAATPVAHAQTFSVIHNFSGVDGYSPYGTLTLDNAGNLYGTTLESFTGWGTAFKLKHAQNSWVLNTLVRFAGSNGCFPFAGVVFGPGGALYGTTIEGASGANCSGGNGLVYSLRPQSNPCRSSLCSWTETLMYQFTGGSDGGSPGLGGLIFGPDGNIYGTASAGGAAGHGAVFKLTRSNGGWAQSVLYSFTGGSDGATPQSGVVFDAAGNLYGTTSQGGNSGCQGAGCGTVYELSPSGSGWTERVLYTFLAGTDGSDPYGGLVFDTSGNLYGTTVVGGAAGGGTVFELSSAGGSWTFTLLHSFSGDGGPVSSLILDAAGNLYGTTDADGSQGAGSVFKLTSGNGGWTFTSLHDFSGYSDGFFPVGSPVMDASGNLFGTAASGGDQMIQCQFEQTCGVVWEITP